MWKHGTTKAGTIRWYCKTCKKSGIKKRIDVAFRYWENVVRRWLIEGLKLRLNGTFVRLNDTLSL